mmetsp:Transcript_34058/g.33598  ORF Transcript_34058/g.33598 Transcript_34058/m.33598 type:complete len:329 (-) Transcript_34058:618-1604(-)
MEIIDKPEFQIRFFKERPGKGTRYIVAKHSKEILKQVLTDTGTFSLKENLRQKCYDQLYNLVICCEESIKPHSQDILKQLYKTILDQDPIIKERSREIAQALGYFVDTDYIIPIIIDHLKDKDSLSLPHYISSCLFVFSELVLYSTAKYSTIQSHLPAILELMSSSDYLNSESVTVLEAVLLLSTNVIKSVGSECLKYKRDLFKVLLQLGSVPGTAHLHLEVEKTIDLLALRCGCASTDDLFSLELEALLLELKETYMDWDENTPARFIFDMLCRKSNQAVSQQWELILEIVAMNSTPDKSTCLRMDMLALIEHFLTKESLQDDLKYY